MHQMKNLATQMTCNCEKLNETPDLTRSFSYTSDNGLCKYETSTCRSKVVATGSSNQINRWQEKLSSGASDLYLQFSVRIPRSGCTAAKSDSQKSPLSRRMSGAPKGGLGGATSTKKVRGYPPPVPESHVSTTSIDQVDLHQIELRSELTCL